MRPENDEGFNFLGLGAIFLLVCAVPVLFARRVRIFALLRRYPVLLFTLVLLTVFAISTNVSIGPYLWEYHIPVWMLKIFGIFRASGRMFWPVFYLLVFLLIYIVVRGYTTVMAAGILGVALCLQVIDTSAGWLTIREKLMMKPESIWSTSLSSPFWHQAASRYRKIRGIPLVRNSPAVRSVAYFAATNRLATDVVFLNRIDSTAWQESKENASERLDSGKYERDSLYILAESAAWRAALKIDPSSDVLMRVDDMIVLAPGWRNCTECLTIAAENNIDRLVNRVNIGERMLFNRGSEPLVFLSTGWSEPEIWGTWSDGRTSEIILPVESPVNSIIIEANALVTSTHPEQRVIFRVGGEVLMSASLTERQNNKLVITVPDQLHQAIAKGKSVRIQLELPDATSPLELGLGADARELALGLISITVL